MLAHLSHACGDSNNPTASTIATQLEAGLQVLLPCGSHNHQLPTLLAATLLLLLLLLPYFSFSCYSYCCYRTKRKGKSQTSFPRRGFTLRL